MVEHIKIAAVFPRIQYVADGRQSSYPYQFPIFEPADLEVWLDQMPVSDGYTVSGAGEDDGGTVTFTAPPPADTVITLRRQRDIKRITDFTPSGSLRARTLNSEFDHLAAGLQQVAAEVERCLRLAPYDSGPVTLPPRSDREAHVLGFDAAGDLTTYPPTSGVTDAANVTWRASETAPGRSVAAKLSDSVSVLDYADLGAALAAARVVWVPDTATIPIDTAISVPEDRTIVIDGRLEGDGSLRAVGSICLTGRGSVALTGAGGAIQASRGDLVCRGLHFDVAVDGVGFAVAVDEQGVSRLHIEQCTFRGAAAGRGGIGLSVTAGATAGPVQDVAIRGCGLSHLQVGMRLAPLSTNGVEASRDIRIFGNHLQDIVAGAAGDGLAIDLHGGGGLDMVGAASGIVVASNHISGCGGGLRLTAVHDATVRANVVRGASTSAAITIAGASHRFDVLDNIIRDSDGGAALRILPDVPTSQAAADFQVVGNRVQDGGELNIICGAATSSAIVRGNHLLNSPMVVKGTVGLLVLEGNTLIGNSYVQDGIRLLYVDYTDTGADPDTGYERAWFNRKVRIVDNQVDDLGGATPISATKAYDAADATTYGFVEIRNMICEELIAHGNNFEIPFASLAQQAFYHWQAGRHFHKPVTGGPLIGFNYRRGDIIHSSTTGESWLCTASGTEVSRLTGAVVHDATRSDGTSILRRNGGSTAWYDTWSDNRGSFWRGGWLRVVPSDGSPATVARVVHMNSDYMYLDSQLPTPAGTAVTLTAMQTPSFKKLGM